MEPSRVPGWIGYAVTVCPEVGEVGRASERQEWSKSKGLNLEKEEADEK